MSHRGQPIFFNGLPYVQNAGNKFLTLFQKCTALNNEELIAINDTAVHLLKGSVLLSKLGRCAFMQRSELSLTLLRNHATPKRMVHVKMHAFADTQGWH